MKLTEPMPWDTFCKLPIGTLIDYQYTFTTGACATLHLIFEKVSEEVWRSSDPNRDGKFNREPEVIFTYVDLQPGCCEVVTPSA